jgi:hypothetical protein
VLIPLLAVVAPELWSVLASDPFAPEVLAPVLLSPEPLALAESPLSPLLQPKATSKGNVRTREVAIDGLWVRTSVSKESSEWRAPAAALRKLAISKPTIETGIHDEWTFGQRRSDTVF